MTKPTSPTINPTRIISFCSTIPVACANALGGVEIGKIMASEADKAKPINNGATPPNGAKFSTVAAPTTAKIGTSKDAVAVFEIKLDNA